MSNAALPLGALRAGLLAIATAIPAFAADTKAYTGTTEVEFGYAPGSALHLGSADLGDMTSLHSRFRYTGRFDSGKSVSWSMGFEVDRYSFSIPSNQPIPNGLGSATLPLGVNWKISDRWSFRGEISPGVYSDFHEIDGSDFNAPVIAGLSYAVNDDLVVSLMVSVDARRDVPLIGGPGVWWRINPRWTVSLLLPRPRVEFRPWDGWTLYAGGEIAGGAYQTGPNAGSKHGVPAMDDVNISYREIRAGLGAQWNLGHGFTLEAAGGWMLDRRFVVDERNLLWNGNGAPYGRVQLSFRY